MADEVAALSVRLEATAARFERDMQRATRAMDRASGRIERRADSLDRRLERVGNRFGVNLDLRATAAAAAIAAVGAAVTSIVRNGDKLKRLEGRFTALTGSADRAAGKIRAAFEIGADAGAPVEDVADALTRFTIAAENIGATDAEVARLTESIIKLGQIGGGTTQQISAGAIQLGQALASGVLQGDELKSILENIPLVAEQIAAGLGVGTGQLREMGKEGELTADKVFGALLKGADDIDRRFSELPLTVDRAATQLANSWALFTSELDRSLGVSERLASVLNTLAAGLERLSGGPIQNQLLDKISELREVQDTLQRRATGTGFENFLAGPTGNLEQRQSALLAEIREIEEQLGRTGGPGVSKIATPVVETVTPRTVKGRGGGGSRTPREVVDDTAVRILEQMRDRVRLLQEEQQLLGLNEAAAVRLQAQFDREAAVRELLNAAKKEGATITEEEVRQALDAAAAIEQLTVALYDEEAALRRVQEQQRNTEDDLAFFADSATNAITGLIDGTLKWNDALSLVLTTILKIAEQNLLDLNSGGPGGIFANIFKAIGGAFGSVTASADGNAFSGGKVIPFAAGGIVNSPTTFPMRDGIGLMGEAGPEAILPLTRGKDGKLGVQGGGGTTVIMNITTQDADSFRRSREQIITEMARGSQRAQRNL